MDKKIRYTLKIFRNIVAFFIVCMSTIVSASTVNLSPVNDARILDEDGDGVFDSNTLNPSSLSIRHFDGILTEKSVMTFDLSALQGRQLTGVSLNAYVVGYTSSTTNVYVKAYADDLEIDLADATYSATIVGQYNPVSNGLSEINIPLSTALIQSILDSSDSLSLRIESDLSTNTQLGSKSSSFPLNLEVSYVDYTSINSINDGKILDSDGNGSFDTIVPSPVQLSVRNFSTLREVSVSNFNIDETIGMNAQQALLHITVSGIANGTSQVDIYGFNDNLSLDLEDATNAGLLLGSYDPTALGLGSHTIALDTDNLNTLIQSGGSLTLRYASEQNAANTQLGSLYLNNAAFLELDLVVAPPEALPPVANAGRNFQVDSMATATLDGTASSGTDAPIVSYSWQQVRGSKVTLTSTNEAIVEFVAPEVTRGKYWYLTFELTVTDSNGMTATDRVSVRVAKN